MLESVAAAVFQEAGALSFKFLAPDMQYQRVQKSAERPAAADAAASAPEAALRVLDVAVDAAEFPEHPNPQLKIALVLESRALQVRWLSANGRAVQGRVACGSCSVMPAQMPYATHWADSGRMLLLSFSPAFLRARGEALSVSACELSPVWSRSDPLLLQLGQAALAAQQDGLASRAYMDAVAEVVMVHLLQRYGSGARPRPPEALVPARLSKVLELIESRLGEDLPVAQLAQAAGLSTYGFARAFAKVMGEPPHRYLLRRRHERAKELLAHSQLPIADIALSLGFSSQAHLTTSFVRSIGTTPSRYRAQRREA